MNAPEPVGTALAWDHLEEILAAALEAVHAGRAIDRVLARKDRQVLVRGRPLALAPEGDLWVLGAGKAAGPMASAVDEGLGSRIRGGAIVVPTGQRRECRVGPIDVYEAEHPLPGPGTLAATREIVRIAAACQKGDAVIFVLSGGASSLLEAPAPGILLEDVASLTERLLFAGADIHAVNAVRRALSTVKAGNLARAIHPATVCTLAVSDVVGDDPAVIGSGPTFGRGPDRRAALATLNSYGMADELPDAIRTRLQWAPEHDVGPSPQDRYEIVASNADAVTAAMRRAERLGYATRSLGSGVRGPARDRGQEFAAQARGASSGPVALVAGGETTVNVRGSGRGGRNQEFALAAGLVLDGAADVTVAAVGTDGTDGPTDAAGAVADGTTVQRGLAAGLRAERYLADNDSYTFFDALGDLVVTGPTGTNVMDLHIALAGTPDD